MIICRKALACGRPLSADMRGARWGLFVCRHVLVAKQPRYFNIFASACSNSLSALPTTCNAQRPLLTVSPQSAPLSPPSTTSFTRPTAGGKTRVRVAPAGA